MPTLREGTELLKTVREKNPDLAALNDLELADLVQNQTGNEAVKPVQQSSALLRGVNTVSSWADAAGTGLESLLADENSPYLQRIAARGVSDIVRSSPEIGISMAAARLPGVGRLLGYGAGSAFSYGRTKAETGDDTAALGSAAGYLASLYGGIKGAQAGRAAAGPAAGKVKGFLAGTLGSAAGSTPGDVLEVVTAPGGVDKFVTDPVALPAYAFSQIVVGGGMDLALEGANKALASKRKARAAIPDMESLITKTEEEELTALRKKPSTEKTELDAARERQLAIKMGLRDEAAAGKLLSDKFQPMKWNEYAETEATLRSQLRLVQAGKKPVMELPPNPPPLANWKLQAFKEYQSPTSGKTYAYNDTLTNPDMIENAIKTDSLGLLLGYGTPKMPTHPTGKVAVLRNKHGMERVAVVLGDGNDRAVIDSLGKMAYGGDVVKVENGQDVLAWRKQNAGLMKLHSIVNRTDDKQDELSFTNHVLEMFNKATGYGQMGLKGPKLQVDSEGYVNQKLLAKQLRDWAPNSLMELYKERGIETLLNPNNVEPLHLYTIYGPEYGGKQVVQIDPLINEGRGEPLTNEQRAALPQPPPDLGTGQYIKVGDTWEVVPRGADYAELVQKHTRPGKVSAAKFAQWLRDNTPEVEVKKLVPGKKSPSLIRAGQLQHELETAGYRVTGSFVYDSAGRRLDTFDGPHRQKAQEYFEARRAAFSDLEGDAATGRYGVEPKELDNMPDAVDILVRLPVKADLLGELGGTGPRVDPKEVFARHKQGPLLFKGPHFGKSDVNVLASIRGYVETLPGGEKVFHAFEIQSDWGQWQARYERGGSIAPGEKRAPSGKEHPLLEHYNRLAVKAAIQHARSIGAKYIAISDAETAMMTEGHDRSVLETPRFLTPTEQAVAYAKNRLVAWKPRQSEGVDPIDSESKLTRFGLEQLAAGKKVDIGGMTEWKSEVPALKAAASPLVRQEKGMRQNYDVALPSIAQKLTGDKGRAVDFGPSKNPASDVFVDKVPGGGVRSKTNVTARLYSIENPSPEVRKLFSLYDADAQASFEHTLRLEQLRQGDKIVTPGEVLETALKGQYQEIQPLLNFLNRIKGARGTLRQGVFENPTEAGRIDLGTREVKIAAGLTIDRATRVLGHEFSHGALHDLKLSNPELFSYFVNLVDDIGQPARLGLLTDLAKQVGMDPTFNAEYHAGKLEAPDAQTKERQAYEFMAGLAELSTQHFLNKNATRPDWYQYLPQPVIRILDAIASKFKQYFGKNYPGVGHMLDPQQQARLGQVVDLMERAVSDQMAANMREMTNLRKSSAFDESRFIESLPTLPKELAESVGNLRGSEVLHSFAKDLYKKSIGSLDKFYQSKFFTALFRTLTKPETGPFFWNLHFFRPTTQSELRAAFANVGQAADGSLAPEQALERFGKFLAEVENPGNKRGQKWLDATSRILEENTNRRQALMAKNQPVERKDLVSLEEMQSKYDLTPEEAEFVDRFSRIPEHVVKERLRKQEEEDSYRIAKMFYRANKNQTQEGVLERVQRLNRIANDFGAKKYELDTYMKIVAAENRKANPDLEVIGRYTPDIQRLQQEAEVFRVLFEQAIRDEFAGSIPMKPERDGFISTSADIMVRMAAQREQLRVITRDIGYAPMTRRGRFNLRVYMETELGEEYGHVKEFLGFDTRAEVDKYIKDNGLKSFDIIDKDEVKERMKLFSPYKIGYLRDKAKTDFQDLIARVNAETMDMDPDQRTFLLDFLNENIEARFQPLEKEYEEVVSIKGDKFKERRYLVPGFDRNDYLPNIVEYLDFNTVSSNKRLTRARGDYLLEDARFDNQLELKLRLADEMNYTLTNQTEWNSVRKGIFYYYLGASPRHIVQNAVQIPLNGISQMVSQGYGLRSYKHFGKAAKLAFQWNMKGITGDVEIDALLKQAEKDGVSFQQSIENPVHESVELQNALDSLNATSAGTTQFGKRIQYQKTQLWRGFERFMQSTSSAAESANRKTTFIASILAQRSKGVTDLRTIYAEASKFTNYVNFTGDKPNRPGYLIQSGGTIWHGPAVTVSALQSFTLNHISQLYAFRKLAKAGSINDKKAYYTGMAHLLAFSGAMGFIGAVTAEALFEEVTGISLKTAMRKGLVTLVTSFGDEEDREGLAEAADSAADLVLTGFPALAGLDVSGSIGLGSPLFRYQAGQPITAEQLGGPGAGLLGRVKQAVGEITADPFNPQQWWAATRTAAPAFLSHLIRVFDTMAAGTMKDQNQQPVSDPLDATGSTAALLGFTPKAVSKQRQFNNEVYKANKRESEDYELRTRNIAAHLHRYNQTGDEKSLLKANEMFSDYLTSVSGLQDRSSMVDSITNQLAEFEGRVTKQASLKSSPGRQKLENAFPSVKSRVPSKTSSLRRELEVALSLGQDDLLYRKLESLPSAVLDALLHDELVRAGLRPEAVGLVQRPGTVESLGPNPDLSALSGRFR